MKCVVVLQADEISGIKIFRYDASLYYANKDNFEDNIFSKTGIDPNKLQGRKAEKMKAQEEARLNVLQQEMPKPVNSLIRAM